MCSNWELQLRTTRKCSANSTNRARRILMATLMVSMTMVARETDPGQFLVSEQQGGVG